MDLEQHLDRLGVLLDKERAAGVSRAVWYRGFRYQAVSVTIAARTPRRQKLK